MRAAPSWHSTLVALGLTAFLAACTGSKQESQEGGEAATGGPDVTDPANLDLWSGLPPLEPDVTGRDEIAPKPSPEKPPQAGEIVELPFPPPPSDAEVPTVESSPLAVLRYGPSGEEGLVDAIRLTFNQPMVPLATVEALRALDAPFTITPAVEGEFRWLGTETVAFYPATRLPFSTTYRIEVPTTTASVAGQKLDKPIAWEITTPALALESSMPYDKSDNNLLDTPIVLVFNQPIDAAKLAPRVTLKGKGKTVALARVPEDEWKDIPGAAGYLNSPEWTKKRVLVLDPVDDLTQNTGYTLTVPAGTWGEGKNPSKAMTVAFRTYPPLTISGPTCEPAGCNPEWGFTLNTSTGVRDRDIAAKVHVTPEVENLEIDAMWGITLRGKFEGLQTYTVKVDAGVVDEHGQKTTKPYTFNVKMAPRDPSLQVFPVMGKNPGVVEVAHSDHEITLQVSGVESLELYGVSASVEDFPKLLDFPWSGYPEWTWPSDRPKPHWNKTIDVSESRRKSTKVTVNLDEIRRGSDRAIFLMARSNEFERWGYKDRVVLTQLVNLTDLGLLSAIDREQGWIRVTSLATGKPVPGAAVKLFSDLSGKTAWSGFTDDQGVAKPNPSSMSGYGLMLVESGDDWAFERFESGDLLGRWMRWIFDSPLKDEPRVFFFHDRDPHKPGETVHVAGFGRLETRGPDGGVAEWIHDFPVDYKVTSPRGLEVAKGKITLGKFSEFGVDVAIPEDGDTGPYAFEMTVPNPFGSSMTFWHTFQVETYRAPEFTVAAKREDPKPLVFGDELAIDLVGEYLFGAPMVDAEASWTLQRTDTDFTPPGSENEGFSFGAVEFPWWRWYGSSPWMGPQVVVARGQGKLDDLGKLAIKHVVKGKERSIDLPPEPEPKDPEPPSTDPYADVQRGATYSIDARVTDENRQAIGHQASFVVHPALHYAGVRAEKSVLREGEKGAAEAVVVDLDGKRLEGRAITLDVMHKTTERTIKEQGKNWWWQYDTKRTRVGGCTLVSAAQPVRCEFDVAKAGDYELWVTTKDDAGREQRARTSLFVQGADESSRRDEDRRLDIVPDAREYAPGSTARVMVRSPFPTAHGVLVVEREGISQLVPLDIVGGSAVVDLPISEVMVPSVTVSAAVVRARVPVAKPVKGQDLGAPAAATGTVTLAVKTDPKKVFVDVLPSAEVVDPGKEIDLTIKTKDLNGAPIDAVVSVFVVDEGVLSLMGYQTPDPLAFFHHARSGEVGLWGNFDDVLPRQKEDAATTPPQTDVPQPVSPSEKDFGGALPGAPAMEAADGFGAGGLGLVGTGRGGGGTGEGSIGLGTTGLIGKGSGSGYGSGSGLRSKEEAAPAPSAAPAKRARNGGGEAKAASLDNAAFAAPVALRTAFATTAYYQRDLRTGATGETTIRVKMPDNLTTFRVMVVAMDTARVDRFGNGQGLVKVRQPIMLRPSLPRFANLGDEFQATVLVDNQSDTPQQALVGVRGLDVGLAGPNEVKVEIPAGGVKEVRFPVKIERVGKTKLQFAVAANAGRDATEVILPVNAPATKQAFATYGATDASVKQGLAVPTDVLPGFGGLELSLSSTALNGLEDAVSYLVDYPYECTEQLASRLIPIFALGPVLKDFPIASLSDKAKREYYARSGINDLVSRQRRDGGFGYWYASEYDDYGRRSWPWLSAWVAFTLVEAERAGFTVDATARARLMDYLDRYVRYGEKTQWGRVYDETTRAFALWILAGEQKRAEDVFDRVWADRDEMAMHGKILLMGAAHRYGRTKERDEILAMLRDGIAENASTIHFSTSVSEADAEGLALLMHSDVQTDATALVVLLEVAPTDPMLPKVVAGIMKDRDPKRGGRWISTHANAWSLVAVSRYYTIVEAEVPDFVARAWLGDELGGEVPFKGREMAKKNLTVPMRLVLGSKWDSVVLEKDGPGKLYYRLGLRYAPADFELKAVDRGYQTFRRYEALPGPDGKVDPDAVRRLDDGTWVVKAGTSVKVTISVVAANRGSFVVVDDPMPAGFEGQNPRFKTSVDVTSTGGRDYGDGLVGFGSLGGFGGGYERGGGGLGWWWPWWSWDHTQMRDDRMLLFADWLPAGVYTYSYTARATTIGDFILPPTHVEQMYEPEVFGHSSSSRVKIVE